MHVSIGKLAALSISLLIAVTIVTTGAGLFVLQNEYRSLEKRHAAEVRDTAQNAAIALRDQIRFYQGVPQFISAYAAQEGLSEPTDSNRVTLQSQTARQILEGMLGPDDRIQIVDGQGKELLTLGDPGGKPESDLYQAPIPDTPWKLMLTRPRSHEGSPLVVLVIFDTLIMLVLAITVIVMIRLTLGGFRSDLTRIDSALEDLLAGRYRAAAGPAAIEELESLYPRIEQLALKFRQQNNKLENHSLSDTLTGLFNRRYFDLMLAHLHEQSERQLPATLAIINLNKFKCVNDRYGREHGDRVLQHMARYLLSRLRATDIVVRLGGDEFGLLLTNMAGATLDDWLAALVHDYDHKALENGEKGMMFCQFSIGVAQIDTQTYPVPTAVFNAAHGAMIGAKQRRQVPHSRYAIARSGNVTAMKPVQEAL